MNRVVLSTVIMLVAVVGLSLSSGTNQAEAGLFGNRCGKAKCCKPARTRCCKPMRDKCAKKNRCGGLFARLRARKCCQPKCCQPEPVCCEPEPVCCEPAPSCGGCDSGCDGCGSAEVAEGCSNCGDTSAPMPVSEEAAPAAPAAPEAPEAPAADDATT